MKKVLSLLLGTTIVYFAVITRGAAQTNEKSIAYEAIKNNTRNVFAEADNAAEIKSAEVTAKATGADLKAMKANFRAAESFKRTFKDAPEVNWATGQNTIVAYFKTGDLKSEAVYNKSGHLLHSLTFYPAEKTPDDVRAAVESNYPNADINLTIHVVEDGVSIFIAHIEDKKTYKEVGVYDGQTELLKEFNKSR